MTESDDADSSTEQRKQLDESTNSGDEQSPEEIPFDEHPIGTSPDEVVETLETVDDGALSEILSKYEPDQFTSLVRNLVSEYQIAKKRKFIYNISLIVISIVLVSFLFGGLLWFTLETDTDGSALIFLRVLLRGTL